ncbi:universal stress protein [Candidatus Oleimmundimicrobium sp.]|uniref:universal stress protein n=1 Tax=Candidatus Oleimmundimicrobium sp. TaxID=3060597 RepID=UPI00272552BD|nr:universal stress protein [Candidatus Oleimmundimicrobium sp.]MDO8885626.1 universal stress protein [Candidatus Oleimmundimicrobium sp.]
MDEIKNCPVDEGHYKILLPLRGTKYSKHLISIACAIAKKRNGRILAVKMMKLSPSVSFSSRMGMLGDELRETEEMLNQIVEDCRGFGVEAEATLISSYSPKKDILELAEKEGCNLIVLEWKGKLGRVKVLENVEEWIMQHASFDVVAFKNNKGIKEINKVLVSTPIGPHAEFTVSIAGSIAELVGAEISFFRVINPRANKEEVKIIEGYQNKLANVSGVSTDTGSRKSSKVAEEIVRETEGHDLVVMSASGDWVFKSIGFGSLPDEVIRKAKSSVIIVRKGISKRESWFRRIRYTIWKKIF